MQRTIDNKKYAMILIWFKILAKVAAMGWRANAILKKENPVLFVKTGLNIFFILGDQI